MLEDEGAEYYELKRGINVMELGIKCMRKSSYVLNELVRRCIMFKLSFK